MPWRLTKCQEFDDRCNFNCGSVEEEELVFIIKEAEDKIHFMELFITALMPVLKLLLITGAGSFLAVERFHILGEDARKYLNIMVFFVFTPALVSSSLADTVTFKSMLMLWFMPLNALLTFIIGTALGWLLIKITKTPDKLQGLVLGCCSSGMKSRHLGPCHSSSNKVDNSTENSPSAPKSDPEEISKCSIGLLVIAGDKNQNNDRAHQLDVEYTISDGKEEVAKKEKIMKHLRTFAEKLNLKAVLTPSTIGTVIGLLIGITPPFRKAFVGDNAPLHVVQDSASMVGDAAIPVMTLLVGANLLKGLKGSGMWLGSIVGIIVVRNIALPILGIGIVKGAAHQFALLLQFALPPAVAISTFPQLFEAGEGECSVIMLATYAFATVSLTLWSTFFMWLVQ
ncbi:hypothetical protein L6164_006447 [Bauhinia variegata]|uniref:Uncharacterized protein n=1 Tax=Bauhinia variegata TaxID=167791 RepID=A0ACB9PTP9_BAUVA|nr:hypothetical protein L6164_006447 [Bauhinia variegata]